MIWLFLIIPFFFKRATLPVILKCYFHIENTKLSKRTPYRTSRAISFVSLTHTQTKPPWLRHITSTTNWLNIIPLLCHETLTITRSLKYLESSLSHDSRAGGCCHREKKNTHRQRS